MTAEELEFTEAVMARVRMPDPTNLEDISSVRDGCYTLFHEGFTVAEAAKFCRLLEEVSPSLPEERALKRMADLKEIVRLRKNAGLVDSVFGGTGGFS